MKHNMRWLNNYIYKENNVVMACPIEKKSIGKVQMKLSVFFNFG